jgi:hypothetical protein
MPDVFTNFLSRLLQSRGNSGRGPCDYLRASTSVVRGSTAIEGMIGVEHGIHPTVVIAARKWTIAMQRHRYRPLPFSFAVTNVKLAAKEYSPPRGIRVDIEDIPDLGGCPQSTMVLHRYSPLSLDYPVQPTPAGVIQ